MKAHPYTVTEGRTKVIWLVLVLISLVVAAFLVYVIVPRLPSPNTFLTQPDVGEVSNPAATFWTVLKGSPLFICFFVVYTVFDRWAWKWPLVRVVPDLNGTWDGELVSERRPDDPLPVTLKIRQSWSNITLIIDSARTSSYSVNAAISFQGPERVDVINTYMAEPKPSREPPVITRHYGTNIIHFQVKNQRLTEITGVYYTERDQGNHGSFHFRVKSEIRWQTYSKIKSWLRAFLPDWQSGKDTNQSPP